MSELTFPVVYHPGTGTYMALSECVTVNVPVDLDDHDIEPYLSECDETKFTPLGGNHG